MWCTPIVTPFKSGGEIHKICGDYNLKLKSGLLKQTCTTVEAEDIPGQLDGPKVLLKVDLQSGYL